MDNEDTDHYDLIRMDHAASLGSDGKVGMVRHLRICRRTMARGRARDIRR